MAAILGSYRDAIAFRPERFNPVLVAGGEHMKAVLTCLEPGQFIPVHRPGVDTALILLEGNGRWWPEILRKTSIPGR
jgi:quercetin dioxygenase-like cupin family protein